MIYAYISNGITNQVIESDDTVYYDSLLSESFVKYDLDEATLEVILNERYYKNESWHIRQPAPSINHIWDNELEVWVLDLPTLKVVKSAQMDAECKDTIYTGFVSLALGSEYLYPANDKDQLNMIASVTDSYNPSNDESWITLFWCKNADNNWNYRPHTASQIRAAGSDGKAFITATLSKNAQLQYLISQATTQEEIEAITW